VVVGNSLSISWVAGHSLDSSASERLRHRQQRTVRGPLMSVTDTTPELTIDADRLWSDLMELAAIGAYDDEATGLVGVNRQSLTDEEIGRASCRATRAG